MAEDEQVIETLDPHCPHPAFRDRIGVSYQLLVVVTLR